MTGKIIFFLLVTLLLFSGTANAENTGTIVIKQQNVDLYIQNNGDVRIHYDDIIQVTSGDCPWITMGLPTPDFTVLDFSGAASSVVPQNSAGWSGVYVKLDKDYKPGQTFEFQFTADQHGFVANHNGQASVEIIPVWFDDTPITAMTVTLHVPPGVSRVSTSDNAAKFGNGVVFWTFANLAAGQRETVGIDMPDYQGVYPAAARSAIPDGISFFDPGRAGWIILFFVALWVFIPVSGSILRRHGHYEDPKITLNSALSGKTVNRNMHLRCPNDDTVMDEKSTFDPEDEDTSKYAICPSCGALFFDRGEIEQALKFGVTQSTLMGNITTSVAPGGGRVSPAPVHTCERCGGAMERIHKSLLFSGIKATLYFCKDCGGLHLQRGEYDQLLQIHQSQKKELEDKGLSVQDVPNNHWLFYPYIYYPDITGHVPDSDQGRGRYRNGYFPVGHYGSAGCVSCACAICACACACAGGGHAGCSPKDRFNDISLYDPPQ